MKRFISTLAAITLCVNMLFTLSSCIAISYPTYEISDDGYWIIDGVKTDISAKGDTGERGPKGDTGAQGQKGETGEQGADGIDGIDGKSAYQLAIEYGYNGTEAEWLASLVGESGKNGTDGKNGVDGENGKTPTFRVNNGILQWKYEGDAVWTDLINLDSLTNSEDSPKTPKEDYEFGEFVPLENIELAEIVEQNGIKTLKYKVGTMYYVPISYGFIQQIYPNTQLTLGYSLSEATETSIERGFSRTTSVSVDATVSGELEFDISIKKDASDDSENGGEIGFGVTVGTERSIEHIYNYIQTTSNMEQYSGSYTVFATDENIGQYCRVALVTNVDYYICYRYDIFDPDNTVIQYTSTECQMLGDNYQFVAKLQFSDSEIFEEPDIDKTLFDIEIDKAKLKSDGLFDISRVVTYEGKYTDYDAITLGGFEMGDCVLWSEIQSMSQLFGRSKDSIANRNIPMNMKLSYSFIYNKERNIAADMRIVVTNGTLPSFDYWKADTIEDFIALLDDDVGILADKTFKIPLGNRKKDTLFTVDDIEIPFDKVGENFYVYLFNVSNDSIEIKNHIYSYTLTPDVDKLSKTILNAYENNTLTINDGESKKSYINFTNSPDMTINELSSLGFTKLNVSFSFECDKKGAMPPLLKIVDSNGNDVCTPNITYSNPSFATSIQNSVVSSSATVTFSVDLSNIENLDLTLIWDCLGAMGTTGSKYVSIGNIVATAYFSK